MRFWLPDRNVPNTVFKKLNDMSRWCENISGFGAEIFPKVNAEYMSHLKIYRNYILKTMKEICEEI